MVDVTKSWDKEFKDAYNSNKTTFSLIGDTLDLYSKGEVTWESIKDKVASYLKVTGLSTEAQAKFMDMAGKSSKAAAEFAKKGVSGLAGKEKEFATSAIAGGPEGKKREEVDKDSLKEMIAQTTTLGAYLGMTDESLKYSVASSKVQGSVAAATVWGFKQVGKIYTLLSSMFAGRYESQVNKFKDSKEYKAIESLSKYQASLQTQILEKEETGDTGGADDLKKELSYVQDRLTNLKNINQKFAAVIDNTAAASLQAADARQEELNKIAAQNKSFADRRKQIAEEIALNKRHVKVLEEKKNKSGNDIELLDNLKKQIEAAHVEIGEMANENAWGEIRKKNIISESASDTEAGSKLVENWKGVQEEVIAREKAKKENKERAALLKASWTEEMDRYGINTPGMGITPGNLPLQGSAMVETPKLIPGGSNSQTVTIANLNVSLTTDPKSDPKAFGEAVAESVQQEVKKEFQKSQLRN